MRQNRIKRIRLKLTLILWVAFATLGAIVCLSVVKISLDEDTRDTHRELLDIAQIAALQIQTQRLETASLTSRLHDFAEIQSALSSVKRIYTVTKSGTNLKTDIVLPSVSQKESILLLSKTGDDVQRVFDRGLPRANATVQTSALGPYVVGMAPLKNRHGETTEVLVIQHDATHILQRSAAIRQIGIAGFVFVVLLGGLFSFILVRAFVYESVNSRSMIYAAKGSRSIMIELSLAGVLATVLLLGIYGYNVQRSTKTELERSLRKTANLEDIRTELEKCLIDKHSLNSTVLSIKAMAQSKQLIWVQRALPLKPTKADLANLLSMLRSRLDQENFERDNLKERMNSKQEQLEVVFILSTLLAVGSLVIVRAALRQQADLIAAQQESERHESAYKQVIENLPIGFYTYRHGAIRYVNDAWKKQAGSGSQEDHLKALQVSLHLGDYERVMNILEEADKNEQGFEASYRLVLDDGEIRHVETRAVPIHDNDGGLRHILGFTIDVTSRLHAQSQLEQQNQQIQASNDRLRQALSQLEANFEATVYSLVKVVEAKDPYTAGHSSRVTGYSLRIGKVLGLSAHDMKILEMGTLIHDIGKIGVPDAVLTKPSALTDEEFTLIRKHPEWGATMVQDIPLFKECVPIVLLHHERLDGRGYPYGLKGEEIPLLVRIASVADCFDAMTSNRSYRRCLSVETAIQELEKDARAGALDPEIVRVLAETVEVEGLLWETNEEQAA